MAVIGTYNKIITTQSETETEDVVVTYPETMDEMHPNYDKRGTTETISRPVFDQTVETFEDVYINISKIAFYKNEIDSEGGTLLDFTFCVYNSEADKNNDPDSFIERDAVIGQHLSISSDDDIRIKAYELLKTQPQFINLTDA